MERPRVSIVVVAWNSGAVLGRCLDSVAAQAVGGGHETIVVDNASTDDTPAVLRGRGGGVRVLVNSGNAGFSAACNQAAREARGAVLVFLNPDTDLLAGDVVERLARAVEAPGVGIAGPALVNPDGSVQESCAAHPTVARALLTASGMQRLLPGRADVRSSPDWLMGAVLAVRADLFADLGGFRDGAYGQDQDLAYRARRRGMTVRLEPSATVLHLGNHSAAQRWSEPERGAEVARAELAFLRAHYPWPRAAAIRAIVAAGYGARAVVHALLRHVERARLYRAMSAVYMGRGA